MRRLSSVKTLVESNISFSYFVLFIKVVFNLFIPVPIRSVSSMFL